MISASTRTSRRGCVYFNAALIPVVLEAASGARSAVLPETEPRFEIFCRSQISPARMSSPSIICSTAGETHGTHTPSTSIRPLALIKSVLRVN